MLTVCMSLLASATVVRATDKAPPTHEKILKAGPVVYAPTVMQVNTLDVAQELITAPLDHVVLADGILASLPENVVLKAPYRLHALRWCRSDLLLTKNQLRKIAPSSFLTCRGYHPKKE